MEKNKILEAAQKNKSKGREYENKESIKSNLLGAVVAIIVGIILFLIEYFLKNTVNISLIVVATTAAAVQFLYEGIKNKKIHLIIIGCMDVVISGIAIMFFIVKVVA